MTHVPPDTAAVNGALRRVQRTIAHALRSADDAERLGDVILLPHQRRAAAQLRRILAWHHGALLADDVGLGKTYSALAVAHRYETVHVLAPAGLLAMWQAAVLRTGQHHVQVHSLHGCSRRAPELEQRGSTLVIIDEAHHLRHRNTARYRHVARAVTGCHVLLLSATPVHNRPADLRTLFALFRGDRDDALREDVLAALIVRRTTSGESRAGSVAGAQPGRPPRVAEHRPWHVPQDRATLDLLLGLPAPLPAHDGAVAGALIRLGLLRAWCSSDAALEAALTRRLQRGEAMRDALATGRHPTTGELAAWITGDDATQLAFPELLVTHTVEAAPMIEALDRHLAAVRTLRAHHRHTAAADTQRAAQLRALRTRHPDTPVVAFSQQARTVQALYRALSDIAGVGMLTADGGRIASGPVPKHALLEAFAPRAHGRPPPPATRALWLLLTTDLLAEGVNLHDAGVVVHLDLPWTAALRAQRVGRAVRLGSQHALVHEYRFAPDTPARRALRLESRLARKLAYAQRLVGAASRTPREKAAHGARPTRDSAAMAHARWQRRLDRWSLLPIDEFDEAWHHARVPIAAVQVRREWAPGGETRALVLLHGRGAPWLLGVQGLEGPTGTRLRVTTSVRVAGELAALADRGVALDQVTAAARWQQCERVVRRVVFTWWRRRHVRAALGLDREGTDVGTASPAGRRALVTLSAVLATCSPADRAAIRAMTLDARGMAMRARGVAAEAALLTWARGAPLAAGGHVPSVTEVRRWLDSWRAHAVLGPSSTAPSPAVNDAPRSARATIGAVLLIIPAP